MMKIALLVAEFPKLSETFIASKFLGLLERSWDVHIVCSQSRASEWGRFPELRQRPEVRRRVHVTWLHRPRWLATLLIPLALLRCLLRAPGRTWRYLRFGWGEFGPDILRRLYLDAELIVLGPDVLHFEFGPLAVGRVYLKRLLDCKLAVSFRGYDLNTVGLEDPAYYREIWEQADALHLLGEDLWRRAQQRGCPAEKPHALIPPAINVDFFSPGKQRESVQNSAPGQPLRVLSVGRLDWRKGYEYGLKAMRILLDQGINCRYRIIGDGKYLEAVAFARRQLGLEGMVELMGARSRQEVKEQMQWADAFLHAAVSEGFCNAVLEAQAMALPVVCTDAGGLPENVADGQSGFVVARRDPRALAEKLALLARDPALAQRMGQAGRERVHMYFKLEDQGAAFEEFYLDTLASPEASRSNLLR